MAKSPFSKRDEQYELSRRALIKWTVAAGAALGVSRSKVFDILEGTAGKGVAFAASGNPTHRSVHIVAGNGGLAWFQLLWPHPEIAQAGNNNFAWHRPGQGQLMGGTNRSLFIGPDTPFANLSPQRQMTCFIAGTNDTHTAVPRAGSQLNGASIFAVASVLQAQTPTVIPIIQVGDATVGTAPGFGQATQVGNGAAIVGLFNSAASRAGGLLSQMGDANLYKAQYDAFAQLNRAANRSTQRASYTTASSAAKFLGTNLAEQLQITDADRAMYGLNGNTRGNVRAIAETLIVSVKSFKMGLTNAVVLPAMRDDPHGAFNGDINIVPAQLKGVMDGFMRHLTATVDDVTGKALADDIVFTISGDTTKDPRNRAGWPDGTAANSNVIYVFGNGHLHTGWMGNYGANGTVQGLLPNGQLGAYSPQNTAQLANASVAYAIAKRDQRSINQFTNNLTLPIWNPLDQ
jgi:hypothetical protein